jgi:signal transduction histidine kinase
VERHLSETAFVRFVDYLVHEMRNPLFGISSTLDAWEPNLGSESDQREFLYAARGAVERMRTILQNLTVWTQPIHLLRSPCSISTQLLAAVREREGLADQRGVALLARIQPDLPLVLVDSERLLEAVGSVIEAAIRRSPEGSSVEVMASEEEGDSGVEAIVISVRDHARNASNSGADEFEEFIEPFRERLTPDGGFELAVARRIIEAHPGTLTARFVADGTLFTIRIDRLVSGDVGESLGSESPHRSG